MQPVLPSPIVRGPAALAIIFITRADSHPWQVRCPEVKNSSSGMFFCPLMGSSLGRVTSKVAIAKTSSPPAAARARNSLFANSNPLRQRLCFSRGRVVHHSRHLLDILKQNFAPAEAADKAQDRRMFSAAVHRRPHFRGEHSAVEGRAEGEVTVNDANRGESAQARGQFLGGKRTEPAHAHESDFLTLLPHLADR